MTENAQMNLTPRERKHLKRARRARPRSRWPFFLGLCVAVILTIHGAYLWYTGDTRLGTMTFGFGLSAGGLFIYQEEYGEALLLVRKLQSAEPDAISPPQGEADG